MDRSWRTNAPLTVNKRGTWFYFYFSPSKYIIALHYSPLIQAEHPLIQSTLPQQHGSNTHSLLQPSCSESKKLCHIPALSIYTRLAVFSITVVTHSFAGHLHLLHPPHLHHLRFLGSNPPHPKHFPLTTTFLSLFPTILFANVNR